MSTKLTPAPAVAHLGKKLCASNHPHLAGTRVEYFFQEHASRKGGKLVLGNARKVSGLNAMLATPGATSSEGNEFFVIVIAEDMWDTLGNSQREALVDHELSHCGIDVDDSGNVKLHLINHDVEEFADILRRHGLWKPDLTDFLEAIGKPQLEAIAQSLPGI